MAEEGHGVTEIVKILNTEGVPTKQMSKHRKGATQQWGRGDLWDNSAVMDTLRNECYMGNWIYGRSRVTEVGSRKSKRIPRNEWIVLNDAIPRLISDEQFATVRELLDAARRRQPIKANNNLPQTVLAGLVKCAKCGRMLCFYTLANKSGRFSCKTVRRSERYGCGIVKIDEAELNQTVHIVLQQQIALAKTLKAQLKDNAIQKQKAENAMLTEIQNLQRLIEQSKQIKIALWEKYRDGSISKEKFISESYALSEQVTTYNAKVAEIKEKTKANESDTTSMLTKQLTMLSGITELTRELALELISEIKVYTPERIEIIWKYGDAFERTLTSGSSKR
jgi:hypothetical protein